MTREQISDTLAWLTQQVDLEAMPYTHDQLRDCLSAYGRLLGQTGQSDYGNALARVIFEELVAGMEQQPTPWEWLATELRFEARVLGNRVEAATTYLRHRSRVTDQDLDLYNERIHRRSR